MHRPQHIIIPGTGIANEKRILFASPCQPVIADGMGDKVMIGQDQMEQMEQAIMIDDIDIPDVRLQKPVRSIHAPKHVRIEAGMQRSRLRAGNYPARRMVCPASGTQTAPFAAFIGTR